MTDKKLINSWDDVPIFATEAEARAWWEEHDFSDQMLNDAVQRERERRASGKPGQRPADILARSRTGAD